MGDERLSKGDFCELVPHLSIEDLLLIEYRIADWKKLVSLLNISQKLYRCNLCMIKQIGDKIRLHMENNNHKIKMKTVKQFYLEGYTYPKNQNIKPVKVMIAKNQKIKNPANVISKTTSNEKSNLKKLPLQTDANKPNFTEESDKGLTESFKADSEFAAPKVVKANVGNTIGKTLNAEKNKVTTGTTKGTCNKPVDANKSNTSNQNRNLQTFGNKQLATPNKQLGKTNNLLKNPFANKETTLNDNTEDSYIVEDPPEVIVIDDDKLSDTENEIKSTESAVKNNETQKMETNADKDSSSKSQIVVNPAALLIEKSTEQNKKQNENKNNSDDKPKYQKNIVIIPTACKNPSLKKPDPHQNKNKPQFVSKTFSAQSSKKDILGLVGVEYVIKIVKHKTDNSPRYECSLCEIRLFGNDMQNHLAGYNHRIKYMEKHFPTALRHFRRYITNVEEYEMFKVLAPILHKLAYAIEEHHGRNLPYECLEWQYNEEKSEIFTKVYSLRHASELTGPSFTQVVDTKEIDKLIAERHSYRPPALLFPPDKKITDIRHLNANLATTTTLITQTTLPKQNNLPASTALATQPQYNYHNQYNNYQNFQQTDFNYGNFQQKESSNYGYNAASAPQVDDRTYNQLVEDFLRDTNRGIRQNLKRSHTKSPPYESKRLNYGYGYERERRKSISPLRKDDIWQAYRHMVDRKLDEINILYKGYTKDPETHPLYNDEWQKFWKRRKDELSAAGLNHRSYNYQPEWIAYFKTRITELYNQSIEEAKVECRERLCLPMVNHTLENPNYHIKNVSEKPTQSISNNKPKPQDNDRTDLKTVVSYENRHKSKVVPVLRLMTALEEQLGSLGPKIIDLMSKTLQVEKTNAKDVDSIILTVENCTLLQTCMEKFKGLVISGLLEGTKANALNKAIQEVKTLLEYADQEFKNDPKELLESIKITEANKRPTAQVNIQVPTSVSASVSGMRMTNESATSSNVQTNTKCSNLTDTNESTQNQRKSFNESRSSPNPQILAVLEQHNIKDLATKFAASLTAQGRTNFTLDQIEKLLSVYKFMEKKKRELTNSTNLSSNSGSSAIQKTADNTSLSDTLTKFIIPSSSSQRDNSSEGQSHSNRTETITSNFTNSYINNRLEQRNNIPPNSSTQPSSSQNKNYSNFSNSSSISSTNYSSNVSQHTQGNNVGTNNNSRNINSMNFPNTINSNLSMGRNMNMNTSQNYTSNTNNNNNNSNMWNYNQSSNYSNSNNSAGSNMWSAGRNNWNGNNTGNSGSNFNQQQNLNTGVAQPQPQQRSMMSYQLNQANQINRPNQSIFQSYSASSNQNQGQNRNNNWNSSSTSLSNRNTGRIPQIWDTSNQTSGQNNIGPQVSGQNWTRF